jgi:hypothetical protein
MLGTLQVVITGAAASQEPLQPVSRWALDGDADDDKIVRDGSFVGSPETGVLPLEATGESVGFDGADDIMIVPHAAAYELPQWAIHLKIQPDTTPLSGNRVFFGKGPLLANGEISIEQRSDGLNAYVSQSGSVFWQGPGGSSNGVVTLPVGVACDVLFQGGPGGTELWHRPDGGAWTMVGSSAATVGLSANTDDIYVGASPYFGGSGFFDGVIDNVAIYARKLTADDRARIPRPVSVTHMNSYTVPVAPSAPTGAAIYVATDGNDATGDGTIGEPYLTLTKALSVVAAGGEIVMRKGVYRNEVNLSVTQSNVTIRGYRDDINADPLNPANWPIIDGSFTGYSWELVNAERQEYRTTVAVGSGAAHGFVVSGSSYQIPRWEPLGGLQEPTRLIHLQSYVGTSGNRSVTSFRATNSTSRSGYWGPGVWRDGGTNRVHIRLQPVYPAWFEGEAIDQIDDKIPGNNLVYLWQENKTLFSSITNGLVVEGLFIRGYHRFYHGAARTFTINRNIMWIGEYINYWIFINSAGPIITARHNIVDGGIPDWVCYRGIKSESANPGLNYGRITFITVDAGGNVTLEDNCLINLFDVMVCENAAANAGNYVIKYNAITVRDDLDQLRSSERRREVAYNVIRGPLRGYAAGTTVSATQQVYYHHNLVVQTYRWVEEVGSRCGHPCCVSHGNLTNMGPQIYHNTMIWGGPQQFSRQSDLCCPTSEQASTGVSRSFKNIYVLWNQKRPAANPPGGNPANWMALYATFFTDDVSNHPWTSDGHCFHVFKDPSVAAANRLFDNVRGAPGSSAVNFNDLAAFKLHSHYTISGNNNGYAPRMEENSVQTNPLFAGMDALTQEIRGRPTSDYLPTAAPCTGETIDITGFGLPGATSHQDWIGALDPNGDGTEIGPRPAA